MKSNFKVVGTVIANLRAQFLSRWQLPGGHRLYRAGGMENKALFHQSALWRSSMRRVGRRGRVESRTVSAA
jgi:hypothetical protein